MSVGVPPQSRIPASLLLGMIRHYSPSPFTLLFRTIELAVMKSLAARHGLDIQRHADLDVGASNGVLGNVFIRNIGLGIDIDQAGLKWARRHKPAYAALTAASGTALPLADGSRRVIFSNSVIEHIPDGDAAFAEIARVLAPGGYLLLSTVGAAFPRLVSGVDQLDAAERGRLDAEFAHYRYYTAADMRSILEGLGLTVLETVSYINARQARRFAALRRLEHRSQRLPARLSLLGRMLASVTTLPALYPRETALDEGIGLAVIARARSDTQVR